MKKTGNIIRALFVFILLMLPVQAFSMSEIMNIRHWAAPDNVRVVIDTSDDISYTLDKKDSILIIQFQKASLSKKLKREILLQKPGIEKISTTSEVDGSVRVNLTLAKDVEPKIFNIPKIDDKPYRVVIDIEIPEVEKRKSLEREQVKVSRKNKIIVIDPGHGGEDPGAVGRFGTYEKHVVLEISKKLRDLINKKDGYRAFLTREGDYYVPFKKRLRIAREYGADLFISIHADAFRRREAKGSSVYCLSLSGASSEAARLLAKRENLADIVGGSPNGENSDESEPIILNMFQTNTINMSKVFGVTLLKHLENVSHVKFNTVQEAPFVVLKLPEIPSVLVETAYISNPKEERMLKSGRFQTNIAKAITTAIDEFLTNHSPPISTPTVVLTKADEKGSIEAFDSKKERSTEPTSIKLKEESKTDENLYKVKRGDSLATIAKKHNTTVGVLLKLNKIKLNDPLFVGRILKITDSSEKNSNVAKKNKGKKVATKPVTYTVKKGDTLDKIAKKFNTNISKLREANQMKRNDSLYVNQKLKLPQKQS